MFIQLFLCDFKQKAFRKLQRQGKKITNRVSAGYSVKNR